MIKSRNILLILLFMSFPLYSNDLVNAWDQMLVEQSKGLLEKSKQAFCFIDENGKIQGRNINTKLGIASVSKILTSIWALYELDENHEFNTKIYEKNGVVHIEGGKNPIFDRRAIYKLINVLNERGINKITKLTYDQNFFFVPQALDNPGHASVFDNNDIHFCKYYEPTPNEFKVLLDKYLNTSNWSSQYTILSNSTLGSSGKCLKNTIQKIEDDYQDKRSNFNDLKSNPSLDVSSIFYQNSNPFIQRQTLEEGVQKITLKSVPLKEIIKFINMHSANLPADLIFHILGGTKKFNSFYSSIFFEENIKNVDQFRSGSGIPYKEYDGQTWTRITNSTSCKTVLKVLEVFLKLSNDNNLSFFHGFEKPTLNRNDIIPKKYLAVGGVEGTIASRFTGNFQRTLIAKTGTLNDASVLAGTVNTTQGKRHFAMVNTFSSSVSESTQASRNIQNLMIGEIFKYTNPKETFDYQTIIPTSTRTFKGYQDEVIVE